MVDKLLIIDFDSLFDSGNKNRDLFEIRPEDIWCAVPFALDKLYRNHWKISLWSSRKRTQFYKITKTLLETEVYYSILKGSRDDCLIKELNKNKNLNLACVKLSLFETAYGKELDSGCKISMIESSKEEAEVLQGYLKSKVSINLSPRIWLEILAVDDSQLDSLLIFQSIDGKVLEKTG